MSDDNSSSLASSGSGADQGFSDQPANSLNSSCSAKTWIGIQLKDNQGNPVPNEAYEIQLPDGRKVQGNLDSQGEAGVSDIDPGNCQIRFPNLDAKSWNKGTVESNA